VADEVRVSVDVAAFDQVIELVAELHRIARRLEANGDYANAERIMRAIERWEMSK
jgi:hypothetical protein